MYQVDILTDHAIIEKGNNDIDPNILSKCMLFDRSSSNSNEVSIIITKKNRNSWNNYLVLMRFHGVNYNLSTKTIEDMYKEILSRVKNNGFCSSRYGGSSGRTAIDRDFLEFIKTPGSLPRKMVGVKIIRRELCWLFYYISAKTGKVAFHKYSTPKKGGKFVCNNSMMNRYPFLIDMAKKKIYAALILHAINNVGIGNHGFSIAPNAVKQEIQNLTNSYKEGSKLEEIETVLKYNTFNNHTLVQHPTGLHRDVFDKGCASLENKVCFALPLQTDSYMNTNIIGRGGRGGNLFVFAVLDWANKDNKPSINLSSRLTNTKRGERCINLKRERTIRRLTVIGTE